MGIPSYFAGNEGTMTRSVVMKAYPCNNTLMKVLIASSSGFNICEIPGS